MDRATFDMPPELPGDGPRPPLRAVGGVPREAELRRDTAGGIQRDGWPHRACRSSHRQRRSATSSMPREPSAAWPRAFCAPSAHRERSQAMCVRQRSHPRCGRSQRRVSPTPSSMRPSVDRVPPEPSSAGPKPRAGSGGGTRNVADPNRACHRHHLPWVARPACASRAIGCEVEAWRARQPRQADRGRVSFRVPAAAGRSWPGEFRVPAEASKICQAKRVRQRRHPKFGQAKRGCQQRQAARGRAKSGASGGRSRVAERAPCASGGIQESARPSASAYRAAQAPARPSRKPCDIGGL